MEQSMLTDMAELLESDGINCSIFLKAYSASIPGVHDIGDIVNRLIGEDLVLGEVRDSNVMEVMATVRECLCYVGDKGAGPGTNTLGSETFSNLLKSIFESITQLSQTSCGLKTFEFVEGHPAYPVYWDFAFLFLGHDKHVLLVGSSSD